MKKIIAVIMVIGAFAPSISSAVMINTSASSHSGGVSAAAGEIVTTEPSESSVHIQTTVVSGEQGGSADVQITNTRNGVRSVESKHYDIQAGQPVHIDAATTSTTKAPSHTSKTTRGISSPATNSTSSTGIPTTVIPPKNVLLSWLNHGPQSLVSFLSRFLSIFPR